MLTASRTRRITLVANVALFLEWEAVLKRPEHLAIGGVTAADVEQALDELATHIDPVERAFAWRPQLTDPDDEMVLEAAINGRADAIATFEVQTFREAADRFGISVLTPAAAWSRIQE